MKKAAALNTFLPERPLADEDRALAYEQVAEEQSKRKTRQELSYLEKKTKKLLEAKRGQKEEASLQTRAEIIEELQGKSRVPAMLEEKLEQVAAEPISTPASAVPSFNSAAAPSRVKAVMDLQGTSSEEVKQLLSDLNININVRLSKKDTANLVSFLLTASEKQLELLSADKNIPVVIKTIVIRLLKDMQTGELSTVNQLWDRVFGKTLEDQPAVPSHTALLGGLGEESLLPSTPVSREAYVLIRERLINS